MPGERLRGHTRSTRRGAVGAALYASITVLGMPSTVGDQVPCWRAHCAGAYDLADCSTSIRQVAGRSDAPLVSGPWPDSSSFRVPPNDLPLSDEGRI
jgi:hypothetical protein